MVRIKETVPDLPYVITLIQGPGMLSKHTPLNLNAAHFSFPRTYESCPATPTDVPCIWQMEPPQYERVVG